MKIIFTFPGQGGQRPAMLAAIPDREAIPHPGARRAGG